MLNYQSDNFEIVSLTPQIRYHQTSRYTGAGGWYIHRDLLFPELIQKVGSGNDFYPFPGEPFQPCRIKVEPHATFLHAIVQVHASIETVSYESPDGYRGESTTEHHFSYTVFEEDIPLREEDVSLFERGNLPRSCQYQGKRFSWYSPAVTRQKSRDNRFGFWVNHPNRIPQELLPDYLSSDMGDWWDVRGFFLWNEEEQVLEPDEQLAQSLEKVIAKNLRNNRLIVDDEEYQYLVTDLRDYGKYGVVQVNGQSFPVIKVWENEKRSHWQLNTK